MAPAAAPASGSGAAAATGAHDLAAAAARSEAAESPSIVSKALQSASEAAKAVAELAGGSLAAPKGEAAPAATQQRTVRERAAEQVATLQGRAAAAEAQTEAVVDAAAERPAGSRVFDNPYFDAEPSDEQAGALRARAKDAAAGEAGATAAKAAADPTEVARAVASAPSKVGSATAVAPIAAAQTSEHDESAVGALAGAGRDVAAAPAAPGALSGGEVEAASPSSGLAPREAPARPAPTAHATGGAFGGASGADSAAVNASPLEDDAAIEPLSEEAQAAAEAADRARSERAAAEASAPSVDPNPLVVATGADALRKLAKTSGDVVAVRQSGAQVAPSEVAQDDELRAADDVRTRGELHARRSKETAREGSTAPPPATPTPAPAAGVAAAKSPATAPSSTGATAAASIAGSSDAGSAGGKGLFSKLTVEVPGVLKDLAGSKAAQEGATATTTTAPAAAATAAPATATPATATAAAATAAPATPATPAPATAEKKTYPMPTTIVDASVVFRYIFLGCLGLQGLFSLYLAVRFRALLGPLAGVVLGAALGAALPLVYYLNRASKISQSRRLAAIPGAKGSARLVGEVPTWLSFRETERLDWLNAMLAKAWPFYDAAICQTLREQIEPLMAENKPSFIKRIFFNKLTFGNDPFQVTGVRARAPPPADASGSAAGSAALQRVALEFDFRWAGDANIVMGIELPAGGSFTRMAPKVSNLAVAGTIQIVLSPLREGIPPFGAALVSFLAPPTVRFVLDVGKAGGGVFMGNAIRLWLDDFIRNQISAQMLWPSRIVVPLIPDEDPVDAQEHYLHHRGALCVDVISSRALRRRRDEDSDPPHRAFVSIWTTAGVSAATGSAKSPGGEAKWSQRLWVFAQEPDSQSLFVAAKEEERGALATVDKILHLGGGGGDEAAAGPSGSGAGADESGGLLGAAGGKTLGRAALPLARFANSPGQAHAVSLPLGSRDFQDRRGCGDDRGELHLRVAYWPFSLLTGHASAVSGAIIVTLFGCSDLVPADRPAFSSDPKVTFKIGGEKRTSPIVWQSLEPRWVGVHLDWFQVPTRSTLELTVWDHDQWSADEALGSLEIDLYGEVQCAPGGDVTKTWLLEDVPKDWMKGISGIKREYKSTITLRIQWIPYRDLAKPPKEEKKKKKKHSHTKA